MSRDKKLSISVTELVDFSARCGNLFDHYEGPTSAEGIAAHRKIQKSRGDAWESEVSVEAKREIKGIEVSIRGRIDLLKIDLTGIVVEEVKTVLLDPKQLPESKVALQLAQAKVYAALLHLSKNHPIDSHTDINIHLTWYNILNQSASSEVYTEDFDSLVKYLDSLILVYLEWLIPYQDSLKHFRESAQALTFPFQEFRPNQREFSATVYRAIEQKQDCLFEAPTGIGKTISTLFPAIKSFGQGRIDQITYLSTKVSTQQLAVNTLENLKTQDLRLFSVVIQAKDRACPCLQAKEDQNGRNACRNEEGMCTRSLGFYERLPEARMRCLSAEQLSIEILHSIADEFHLCPFELSLQMARWANLVIADVNYAYDPLVRLPMFKERGSKRCILLDEAHNLVERGRMMYSAALDNLDIFNIEHIESLNTTSRRHLKKLRKLVASLNVGTSTLESELDLLPPVFDQVQLCISALVEFSLLGTAASNNEQFNLLSENDASVFVINDFVKKLIRFSSISELEQPCHVRCVTQSSHPKHRILEIYCRDASGYLATLHKNTRSTIGFSATLRPTEFFIRTLGFNENTLRYSVPSYFPPENQLTLLCPYIDTRFEQRTNSLPELVQFIEKIYRHSQGNCLIYFPSYQYLADTQRAFLKTFPELSAKLVEQLRGWDQSSQRTFLGNFVEANQRSLGFAIAGGVFGEGIDFSGESLSAAVIVGTGMPPPSIYTRTLQDYFEEQELPAFPYTYRYPGFIRVLQTAGRVIRSEHDKGIVALVDPRFTRPEYLQLMPQHWAPSPCNSPEHVEQALNTFYKKKPATQ